MTDGEEPPKGSPPKKPPRKRAARKVTPKAPEIASVTPINRPRRRPDGRARGGPAPDSPKALTVDQRREEVMQLSRLGFNGPQIATRIKAKYGLAKYTKTEVYKDRAFYLDAVHVEVAADYLDTELDLLRQAQTVAVSIMMNSNMVPAVRLDAVTGLLRVMHQRARYTGGYAPAKINLTDEAGNVMPWLSPQDDPMIIQAEAIRILDEALPRLPPEETGTS